MAKQPGAPPCPETGAADPLPKARTAWDTGGINPHMALPRQSSNPGCHFFLIVYFLVMPNWALFLFFCHDQGA